MRGGQEGIYKGAGAMLKSKLNAGNMMKAISTLTVLAIRYSAGVIDWIKSEFRN